ncbi:hypothetical protein [Maricaulis sp.]|uniref:hypothetical protein n=1 Tax=Maricaulis sp. TaxID=1486257 RepID=UPI00262D5175|nr:hypothetical protein [Maricaulis sp.]
MIRVSLLLLAVIAAIGAPAAQASTVCLEATVILRDVTIEDASGRWEHQDVLIEDGVITAMGGGLEVDGVDVAEWALGGHIIRPAVNDAIIIRVSARASAGTPSRHYLMPGEAADFDIFQADGEAVAALRNGQPAGQCYSG